MSLQLIDVLQKSYFPIELPPPFNTKSFGSALTITTTNILGFANTRPHYSIPTSHNLVRAGGLRRNLSIPNPKHFYKLANHLVNNWNNILPYANVSKYSLTKPVLSTGDRAISPEFSLNERSKKVAHLRSTAKYILQTDISRFFPSIYSHCIPWAIYGKATAKALHASNQLKGTWQDSFDVYSRGINNNQTVGIPIGTDTSRVIAEVVLGNIDKQLAKKFKKLKGIRFIDDYEFALESIADAENVLSYLQYLLNEYDLALNPNKTRILKLPDLLEPLWTSKLRTFSFRHTNEIAQMNDLTSYFDLVFNSLKNNPDEGMLKYAIARLRSECINRNNWPTYESLLMNCAVNEPACLPQICEQLDFYQHESYKMNKQKWSEVLNGIIYEKVPLGQSSEAAWAMWILKLLTIRLSSKSAKLINETDDSVVALMGIGLANIGLTKLSYFSNLQQYSNIANIYNAQWLLCYELNHKNLFNTNINNLSNDSFFNYLTTNSVSFFDMSIIVPTPIRRRGIIVSQLPTGIY